MTVGGISNQDLDAAAVGLLDEWRDHAACIGRARVMDPPLQLRTDMSESARTAAQERALAVCRGCPVRPECQEWALQLPVSASPGWVVGGMTEMQLASARAAGGQVAEGHKRCTRCEEVKPLSAFYPLKRGGSALRSQCKPCHRTGRLEEYYARKGA